MSGTRGTPAHGGGSLRRPRPRFNTETQRSTEMHRDFLLMGSCSSGQPASLPWPTQESALCLCASVVHSPLVLAAAPSKKSALTQARENDRPCLEV